MEICTNEPNRELATWIPVTVGRIDAGGLSEESSQPVNLVRGESGGRDLTKRSKLTDLQQKQKLLKKIRSLEGDRC